MAAEHEAAGQGDLGRFLAFLDNMEKKGLIAAGQEGSIGAVTLMSIHKSKGLEFPVVFVSGLSRSFNQESLRAQVLCDQELGLGLSAVDEGMRVRYPTIAKRAIMVKTAADSLSEEMRVLYVALTRARDRLIMTYAAGNLESDIASLVQRMGVGKRELMCRDVVCPGEWVLIAALHRTEAGELFQLGGNPQIGKVSQSPWRISVTAQAENSSVVAQSSEQQEQIPENLVKRIKAGLEFSYPYMHATTAPSKQTATQRKGRHKDAETAENAPKRETLHWRKPSFVKAGMEATAYGTAVHSCMQHIDYGACIDEAAVKFEVERLVMAGILSKEQGEIIPVSQIAAFFQTVLGKKLQSGSEVLREFKFSILEDGVNYEEALAGEQILLQGVVDCALVEDDGITVVDFKTDYVTEEGLSNLVERYRPQVDTYGDALSRIFQQPIKAKFLYLFHLDRLVAI
jgi:ATP-dependent helicase/nuclease subunit A